MSGARARTPLGWLVAIVEALTGVAVVVTVVLLFANEPAPPPEAAPTAEDGVPGAAVDGATIYADDCAACHGADGGGGVGPALAEGAVVAAFPEVADQVVVVAEGRGGMPSFGDRLTPEQITAVVDYTRSL